MSYEIFDRQEPWEGMGEDLPASKSEEPGFGAGISLEEDPDMEVTYVLFKDEPGMDQMYEQAQQWLEMPGGMLDQFLIYPVNIE